MGIQAKGPYCEWRLASLVWIILQLKQKEPWGCINCSLEGESLWYSLNTSNEYELLVQLQTGGSSNKSTSGTLYLSTFVDGLFLKLFPITLFSSCSLLHPPAFWWRQSRNERDEKKLGNAEMGRFQSTGAWQSAGQPIHIPVCPCNLSLLCTQMVIFPSL